MNQLYKEFDFIEALQAARDLLADMPIPDGYYSASIEVISKLDKALSQGEFEKWYSKYDPEGKGYKQRLCDAYTAGAKG
jgi:hypothetical protein